MKYLDRKDEEFIRNCVGPSRGAEAMRREKRILLVVRILLLLTFACWYLVTQVWPPPDVSSQPFDFAFLCCVIAFGGLSMFTQQNIRLILALRAIQERLPSEEG